MRTPRISLRVLAIDVIELVTTLLCFIKGTSDFVKKSTCFPNFAYFLIKKFYNSVRMNNTPEKCLHVQ